jgi:peptidoglycan hydrolase-like protein with peptidoglycan-binding domain
MQAQSTTTISLPVLQQGASGEAVRLLQKLLIVLGNKITFDAQFGLNTKNAVIAFQKSKSLTADGIVGQATWRALTDAI